MVGQMQTIPNIQGIRNAQAMPNTMGNAMPNAGPNVMQQTNTTPGTMNANMNMAANIGQQANATGPAPNMVGQINQMNQMNQMNPVLNQMNPMMRNQNAPNAMFQGNKSPFFSYADVQEEHLYSFRCVFFLLYFQFEIQRRISNFFEKVQVHQHHHQWVAIYQIR